MENIILVISVTGTLLFGFFLMIRLDRLLEKHREKTEHDDSDSCTASDEHASCVMLTDELTDEEIAEELRRFRKAHEKTRIMIYEDNGSVNPNKGTDSKQ